MEEQEHQGMGSEHHVQNDCGGSVVVEESPDAKRMSHAYRLLSIRGSPTTQRGSGKCNFHFAIHLTNKSPLLTRRSSAPSLKEQESRPFVYQSCMNPGRDFYTNKLVFVVRSEKYLPNWPKDNSSIHVAVSSRCAID